MGHQMGLILELHWKNTPYYRHRLRSISSYHDKNKKRLSVFRVHFEKNVLVLSTTWKARVNNTPWSYDIEQMCVSFDWIPRWGCACCRSNEALTCEATTYARWALHDGWQYCNTFHPCCAWVFCSVSLFYLWLWIPIKQFENAHGLAPGLTSQKVNIPFHFIPHSKSTSATAMASIERSDSRNSDRQAKHQHSSSISSDYGRAMVPM